MITIVLALLYLAVIGFLTYLIITYIPMPEPFKQVITVAVVIMVVFYVLAFLGGHAPAPTMPVWK